MKLLFLRIIECLTTGGLLVSLTAGGLLVSCSSETVPPAQSPSPDCPLQDFTLAMVSSSESNAIAGGQGYPVQLRIYELKSDLSLRNASFEEIWHSDKSVLGGDLISAQEHTLFPDKAQRVNLKRNPAVGSIAFVALFREPQGKDWYVTYDVMNTPPKPPCSNEKPKFSVWLDHMQISDGAGRVEEFEQKQQDEMSSSGGEGATTSGGASGSEATKGN
jgi:type VI secretion system VasD/TssJ family lipoprotein